MPPKYSTPTLPSPAEEVSYADVHLPFKNRRYTKNQARRTRTLKQILTTDRERSDKLAKEKREAIVERAARGEVEMANTAGARREPLDLHSFEPPPSLLPAKKYCDITGLEAPYLDPSSTLKFHNAEVYELMKTFSPGVIQSYLAVRGKAAVLT